MFRTEHTIGRIINIHEQCQRLIQYNYAYDCGILLEDAN